VAEVFGLQANRPGDATDGELSRQHAAGALPAGGAAGEGGCGWWRVVSKNSAERRYSSRAFDLLTQRTQSPERSSLLETPMT
jgi:hypothetical protein